MKITIVGTGLIGGSIALRLKEAGIVSHVYGVDKNETHLSEALDLGLIDEAAPLEYAIKHADVVLVSIPVEATRALLPQILDLVETQTVMDVGSTKLSIINAVKNHPKRKNFVATHPMWGTENSGPKAALADSFSGRAAVICDQEDSNKMALDKVIKIYHTLGMNLLYMNALDHDVHTAYISHISHITSYALANTVLEKEREEDTIFQLASSGFSSTVRLAKSHPEMWVPIFKHNKENVLDVLNEHISQLRKFKSALEKENYNLLEELILNANKIRRVLGDSE